MPHLIRVADPDEIPPGKGKTVLLEGREVTVCNLEGRYVATSTWARHPGPPSVETTCEMPGHRFEAHVESSPARLRSDELRYEVRVDRTGVYVLVEEGHTHPGEEPRTRRRPRRR
jgi:hypothetical protein